MTAANSSEVGEAAQDERLQGVEELGDLIASLPEELRSQALTHSTWTAKRSGSYERLAFLGDSVLGLAIADEVYRRYPERTAGRLSQIANQTVSGVSCAAVGRELGVPAMLEANEPAKPIDRMPATSLLSSGRPLPEVTEALIGACYLAHGFERTRHAVRSAFESRLGLSAETTIDFKSALQELLAQRGAKVEYRVESESGPPHRRTFEIAAVVGEEVAGRGSGRSKKAAEQEAAEEALGRLEE